MAILVPAILTRDPNEVSEKLQFLKKFPEVSDVQIDFADGQFAPNRTILPDEITRLPAKFKIEAHMMVKDPQHYFHNLEDLGISSVILHYESFSDHHQLESALRNIKFLEMKSGLAVNPNTDISVFDHFSLYVDVALVLGVNPGFQGQQFIPETLDRLKVLRERHEDVIIEVDGGVKLGNVGKLVGLGVDRVVVGSGIWVTQDPEETLKEFLKIIRNH